MIEVREASSVEDIPYQSLQAKLCHTEDVHDVLLARLKFTRGGALRFLPGQFVQLTLPSGATALLPISSCPCESATIEMHLPLNHAESHQTRDSELLEAEFGQSLFGLNKRDRIGVTGPMGGVSVSQAPVAPQLFLATDIEFRHLQGLIEHLFNLDTESPIGLVWLNLNGRTPYRDNLCRSWADAMDNFNYWRGQSVAELQNQMSAEAMKKFVGATVYCASAPDDALHSVLRTTLKPNRIVPLNHLADNRYSSHD